MAETVPDLDLDGQQLRIHIIGVGGAGMRAIASVLASMGHRVSGSDRKPSPGLDRLQAQGVGVAVGHAARNVEGVDVVARSTAIPDANPEVVAARAAGIPVVGRATILAAVTRTRRTLSVSGTHGKTTTTTMAALVLVQAGLSPSFIIGGDVNDFGSGAVWDSGPHLVVEADESDGTFTELATDVAVVTNIEADHLDHYGDLTAIEAAFDTFVAGARVAIVGVDEPHAAVLAERHGAITYGTSAGADFRIVEAEVDRVGTRFAIDHLGERIGVVDLPIPGMHNARNATAALLAGRELGAPVDAALTALGRYAGVARRYQFRGTARGITFVDDYAHNPGKVAAVVATAARGGWRRVVVVFQPHRYSRTEALWRDFADSFIGADLIVITDVDGAGEPPRPGITGQLIADAVAAAHPDQAVTYLPSDDALAIHLVEVLDEGDLCLTLGAGTVTALPDELLRQLGEGVVTGSDLAAAQERAATVLGGRARRGVPLGPLTTYRVGGPAALLVEAEGESDLGLIARAVVASGLPTLVIGKGSNLLVADAGFPGIAVILGAGFAAVEIEGTTVRAGSAASLPVVARRTAAAGLTGFEWAVGVPGSIGGAVRMNAGGHGSDMAACLRAIRVADLTAGEDGAVLATVPAAALELGYRRSCIAAHQVVIEAELALRAGERKRAEDEIAAIVRWRRENQPGGTNAGSVFTNPQGDSAGRLIDAAGARGRRLRSAAVSDKHANFIQADAGGRADDVFALMVEVAGLVEGHSGVRLEPETRLIGFRWPDSGPHEQIGP